MAQLSRIEWTNATWNPVTGCTQVSAGCDHCYALALARRRLRSLYIRRQPVNPTPESEADPFAVRLWPERVDEPQRWRAPRMIFVNSMSDVFHADIPEEFTRRLFQVMVTADRHIYQILTKRPARAARFIRRNADLFDGGEIPDYIWIGTSVELTSVRHRVDHLRMIPARVRFLSCEPLLGPLDLDLNQIQWVIAGGESGRRYRRLDLDWARSIRDQCLRANVPFFFKQVGGYTPKAGGRELDGRHWDQFPSIVKQRRNPA